MEQTEMEVKDRFVRIDPTILRKPYNAGRVDTKVSLTTETQETLEEVGVIERKLNKWGKWVAKKGGYGSAFIELALDVMFLGMCKDGEEKLKLRTRVRQSMKNALDDDGILKFKANMIELLKEL